VALGLGALVMAVRTAHGVTARDSAEPSRARELFEAPAITA
jgi:hypothetical protein